MHMEECGSGGWVGGCALTADTLSNFSRRRKYLSLKEDMVCGDGLSLCCLVGGNVSC